jgi:tetratricopeptide (TPR) repeat protein
LIFDDLPFFSGVLGFAEAPFDFYLRWFPYVTIGVTSVFAGVSPPVFRVENLLLHGLNVLLLLLLLRLWISVFIADTSKEKLANWGAWLGALVFAVHPLAVYGVGYLIQRSILMATLFALIMQLAYLRGILENNKRYMALAVAAYFLAVFSKEHSIMAPALLLPLTWLLRDRIPFSPRVLFATWGGFFVVALLVIARMKGLLGVAYEPDAASLFGQQEMLQGLAAPHLLSALTQAGLYFKYLLLMLIPSPAWMSIDMRETFILSYRDWTNWLGLFAFLGYGIFALRCLFKGGRLGLFGTALLYPWLLFMTEFSSVRVQENFVLYRAYLWMPGLMLLVPLLVSAWPAFVGWVDRVFVCPRGSHSAWAQRRAHPTQEGRDVGARFIFAGVVIVLLLVPLSWNRLWVMADNYRLWDDAVQLLHGEDGLGSQRTYYNRALYAATQNNWDMAIADYQKSLSIDSSHPQVFIALASAYYGAKRYDEAQAVLDKVIAKDGKNDQAYYNKGMVLKAKGDKVGAFRNLETSCELGNQTACILVNFARHKEVNSSSVVLPKSP